MAGEDLWLRERKGSSMTLSSIIRRICSFWRNSHPDKDLERIPAYRRAAEAERRAKARGCTQAIGRARMAKRNALHRAMADGITKASGKMGVA